MHDVLTNVPELQINCLDKGFVRIVDSMPRLVPDKTADFAIVQAARVSYGNGTKSVNEDRGLIRYLMRHSHTTPFEMCLAGSTLIPTMPCKGATRKSLTIKQIADAFALAKPPAWVSQLKIRTVNADGSIVGTHIKYAKYTGKKEVFRIKTKGPLQRSIVATGNHPFLKPDGTYVKLEDLKVGDQITLNGSEEMTEQDDNFQLRVYPGIIESIEKVGIDDVYDLEVVSDNHNFVADGFVVHNCEFKFHCKMPIFVARQWIRHRTANVNEYSGRYSVMKDEFYIPTAENVRKQSKTNKQGGDQPINQLDAQSFLDALNESCENLYKQYEEAISSGVSREQARMILPVNNYTEWYWKIDLHNLFHFLALRCDAHAQMEIRVFAEAILKLIEPIVPIAVEAWNDYHPNRGAVKLTRLEIDALQRYVKSDLKTLAPQISSDNGREKEEWVKKAKLFGLDVQE